LNIIEIDGSYGEGGGQLLRMSMALSAIAKKPVKVINIRAKRPKPGLAAQHITAIKSVAELSGGEVSGLTKGSQVVEFQPSEISGGDVLLNVGTAGSVTLVLQASILASIFARNPTNIRIIGGTDVRWSPPFDYFKNIFIPIIKKMGIVVELTLAKRGYYPRGGGEIVASIEPVGTIKPLAVSERGSMKSIRGLAHISNLPREIAERMKIEAEHNLKNFGQIEVDAVQYESSGAIGSGGAIVLWAEFENTIIGSNHLAEKGLKAERVAQLASEALKHELESGCTLDVYCADQVLPYMALAQGESCFTTRELSNHAKTNIWLIEQFLDVKFDVEKQNGLWKVSARKH
jgi:RNA 3'-phosphate cyclase